MAGLEVDCAIKMQHACGIDMWGVQPVSRAVLRNPNSCLRPHATRVAIGKVPGCAGGNWALAKESSKTFTCLADLRPLNICRQKTHARLLWVPILVSHPWHSPIDIGRFRLPKKA